MAFDRTNPTHLASLKTEVTTDPLTLGYVPASTQTGVLDVLNVKRGSGDTHPVTVSKPKVSAALIRTTTTYDAYNTATQDEQEWLRWMTGSNGFEEENLEATDDLRLNLYGYNGSASDSIWSAANRTAMNAAMQAIFEVDGSRAEELFGFGTVITRDDWFAARDS